MKNLDIDFLLSLSFPSSSIKRVLGKKIFDKKLAREHPC